MATRIQLRRGSTAEWAATNPVLAGGEIGAEDVGGGVYKFKIGDGVRTWASLGYATVLPGAYVPLATGFSGNGTTNDRAAFAAADAVSGDVYLGPGTYRITSNLTLTQFWHLAKGAVIKPDSGVTVTFAAGISAGAYQVFDHSAGGKCIPAKTPVWSPEWWGATTGTGDQSTAWAACFAAVTAGATTVSSWTSGQRVAIPVGETRLWNVTVPVGCSVEGSLGTSMIRPFGTRSSGSMITFSSFSRLTGCYVDSNSQAGIVLLDCGAGNRVLLEKLFVAPNGAATVGIKTGDAASRTNFLTDIWMLSNGTGIGVQVNASDTQVNNLWIGSCDIGIKQTFGSGRFNQLHIWGCTTAGIQGALDGASFMNAYVESNLGWGCDFTDADRVVFSGGYVWNNGTGIASTGGMRFRKSGATSCRDNVVTGTIFDDNTGFGLWNASDGLDVDGGVRFGSRTKQGGGAAVCSTAIFVDSASTKTRIRARAKNSDALTAAVTDNATDSDIEVGGYFQRLTSDFSKTNNTYADVFAGFTAEVGDVWEIEAFLFADSDGQTGDIKVRVNPPAGGTGAVALLNTVAASASSTSAVSMTPNGGIAPTNGNTGTAAGLVGTSGTPIKQGMLLKGIIDNTAGAAGLVPLQAAQNVTDASASYIRTGSYFKAIRRK